MQVSEFVFVGSWVQTTAPFMRLSIVQPGGYPLHERQAIHSFLSGMPCCMLTASEALLFSRVYLIPHAIASTFFKAPPSSTPDKWSNRFRVGRFAKKSSKPCVSCQTPTTYLQEFNLASVCHSRAQIPEILIGPLIRVLHLCSWQ